MAKKKKRKKRKSGPRTLSPKTYIQTKARQLPIYQCLISDHWQESRFPVIMVARKHLNDHITCGVYLVDMLCLGVKDTVFGFNMTQLEYEEFQEEFSEMSSFEECDYALAHNIIYGSVEFARDYGLQPHKDFWVTQHLLEDPATDIELMDIEFGEDGMPCVVATLDDEPKSVITQLGKTAGSGNYKVVYVEDLDFSDNYVIEAESDEAYLDEDPSAAGFDLSEQGFSQSPDDEIPDNQQMRTYKVSFEPIDKPNYFSPEEDMRKAEKLHHWARSGSGRKVRKAITELKALIEKYPSNPIYYNYLTIAYEKLGDHKTATQVCEYTYQRFPDYLFSRCNYALYLLDKKKVEKIPDIFNNTFELQFLYPDRDVFHISEVLAFHAVMCRYFTSIDDLITADIYCSLLEEFDDLDSPLKDFAIRELKAKKKAVS